MEKVFVSASLINWGHGSFIWAFSNTIVGYGNLRAVENSYFAGGTVIEHGINDASGDFDENARLG